ATGRFRTIWGVLMISMTFIGPPSVKSCRFYNDDRAKADASIQKNSDLSQGPVHPFGGRLSVRAGSSPAVCQVVSDLKEVSHHERAGCRGETGLGFRHRVGCALFNPGSSAHGCMGKYFCVANCEYRL